MTAVVLMYHRVTDAGRDTYGLAVTPERFGQQVQHLAARGCVVPLSEVTAPGRALRIAITFDDGYADNATTAAPLLEQAGLPATYFITTGRLGGRHFWWDRLAEGFLGSHPLPQGVDVAVAGRPLWLSLADATAREAAVRFLHRRLRPLPPDELAGTVDSLLAQLGVPDPPADERSMTDAQLIALAGSSHAEIGGHTRTHLQLGGQRASVQADEVGGSIEDLRTLLGRPVTSFAYPFGSALAVGDLAPRLAREAGCDVACSTAHAPVTARSDPYRLPRLDVRDWTAPELATQIDRLLQLG